MFHKQKWRVLFFYTHQTSGACAGMHACDCKPQKTAIVLGNIPGNLLSLLTNYIEGSEKLDTL